MKTTTIEQLVPGTVALVGIPWDENSSHARGAAVAPPRIREALCSDSSNLCAEDGTDLADERRFVDIGDMPMLETGEAAAETIRSAVDSVLGHGARCLALGGDHAVTYPILSAYAKHHADLTILHVDAHPDLYDSFDGNRLSHASPFARIMEDGLARRLVQVGIRTINPHQREQAERFGVEVFEMRRWREGLDLDLSGRVYVSIDLDGLDPAFAPGVAHPEPGGLSTRDVVGLVQSIQGLVIGADVVEYNPDRDVGDLTARVAAKLVKELAARMLPTE
jgi:agmatinase